MLLQVCALMITVLIYIDRTALFIICINLFISVVLIFCVCCSIYMCLSCSIDFVSICANKVTYNNNYKHCI